jgi:outer membrane protein OmpA-like peptidoglycan-associated protein
MKKVFITMIACLAISSSVMAEVHEDSDSVRYLATKAWKNWFVSAEGNIDWWQGSDMNPNGNYTAVQWGKPSFGAGLSVGKWLTHSIGLRLSYDVNGGKSYIKGLYPNRDHLFGFLYDDKTAPDGNGYYTTSFIYHNAHCDVLFSPIDFFQGYYNPDRLWTPVLYVGMGTAAVSEGILINPTFINNVRNRNDFSKQKGLNFEFSFNAGLINNFRISEHLDLNLALKWSTQEWHIDSWYYEIGGQASDQSLAFTSDIRPKRADNNYSIGLGLTYYFSREYDLPNDCCKEMDSVQKKLDEFVMPDPIHDTVVKFVNVQTEDIESYPFSIFFNRDSYQLMSRRDIVNLREIAKVAKENGYKLHLTGSCDSATATPAYNQTLSENRCNKIKIELLELGISEDQIIIEPIGGVKILDPTEYDRRVLIKLVKEGSKDKEE